jgi:hypothetical protein
MWWHNVILISVCAWFVSQLLKVIIGMVQKKHVDFRYLINSGGMPSSHSALVCALATSVAAIEGIGSASFGIATILALVVMYDAAGVRRSVGRLSAIMNRMVREIREHRPTAYLEHDLRELVGHTPFQVIIGAILGVAVAFLWVTFVP